MTVSSELADAPCPCGSSLSYADCCGPFLSGDAIAPTAEALMRSRYTAYATGDVEYLVTTHHPSKRSLDERAQIRQGLDTTAWVGLTIIATAAGQPDDDKGMVEFVALYQPKSGLNQPKSLPSQSRRDMRGGKTKGKSSQLHERSQFIKRRERWFYLDGDQLPPLVPKRNDPCWCGSQKKFKHCHGR